MSYSTSSPNRTSDLRISPAMIGLLIVQMIIGYEWLMSGVTKVASGTFVSGLAANLKSGSDSAPQFYRSFLSGTVIPNARVFGLLIEIGELAVGIAFIGGAIVWLTRASRLSDRWRMALTSTTMLAALAGTSMAINFHLLSGANQPWSIPSEGFDETIDVDIVLAFIQMVYFAFAGYLLMEFRRRSSATEMASDAREALTVSV